MLSKILNNCGNLDCPTASGNVTLEPFEALDIKVSLTDHTGTLENCRLTGKFAERILDCDVSACKFSQVFPDFYLYRIQKMFLHFLLCCTYEITFVLFQKCWRQSERYCRRKL